MTYEEIVARKSAASPASGFPVSEAELATHLFPHQRDLVRWALRRGRAALFADTGLGKGPMEPVAHTSEEFPVELWQRYASPVWMDIHPSDTLQYRSAREDDDEKHICPLQLEVVRRLLRLWSNPGDVVLSPFAGIGSEVYVALQEGRKFVGAELKESYYKQASANLAAIANPGQGDLFAKAK